jgi:hypothetical protein
LPSLRALEDIPFTRVDGQPYLEEQYLPGPGTVPHDGYEGLLKLTPMYVLRLYTPANSGISASAKYADAILRLFAPGTVLPLPNAGSLFYPDAVLPYTGEESLVVRADFAPYPGQRSPSDPPGWSVVPITIPLECRSISILASSL